MCLTDLRKYAKVRQCDQPPYSQTESQENRETIPEFHDSKLQFYTTRITAIGSNSAYNKADYRHIAEARNTSDLLQHLS